MKISDSQECRKSIRNLISVLWKNGWQYKVGCIEYKQFGVHKLKHAKPLLWSFKPFSYLTTMGLPEPTSITLMSQLRKTVVSDWQTSQLKRGFVETDLFICI